MRQSDRTKPEFDNIPETHNLGSTTPSRPYYIAWNRTRYEDEDWTEWYKIKNANATTVIDEEVRTYECYYENTGECATLERVVEECDSLNDNYRRKI